MSSGVWHQTGPRVGSGHFEHECPGRDCPVAQQMALRGNHVRTYFVEQGAVFACIDWHPKVFFDGPKHPVNEYLFRSNTGKGAHRSDGRCTITDPRGRCGQVDNHPGSHVFRDQHGNTIVSPTTKEIQ